MLELYKKTSIYLKPQMLEFFLRKAVKESRSISTVIFEAVSLLPLGDAEDIADFDAHIGEPNFRYDEFIH